MESFIKKAFFVILLLPAPALSVPLPQFITEDGNYSFVGNLSFPSLPGGCLEVYPRQNATEVLGSTGTDCGGSAIMNQNGVKLPGLHVEAENDAPIGPATTAVFHFKTPYSQEPACVTSNSQLTSNPVTMSVSTPATLNDVTVYNLYGGSYPITFNIICVGW